MPDKKSAEAGQPTMGRRQFLMRSASGVAVFAVGIIVADSLFARVLMAQPAVDGSGASQSSASNVEMTPDSYKPVRRAPKPNAAPVMDDKQLEALERTLACPCPCTLDIYTCRTTDFTCGISPAVHGDLQALVAGGYSAEEIMTAMTGTYGDFILMAPRKEGFSLLAWFAPFAAVGVGAVAIGAMLRSWRRNADAAAKRAEADVRRLEQTTPAVDATSDELAKLEAALRDDSR